MVSVVWFHLVCLCFGDDFDVLLGFDYHLISSAFFSEIPKLGLGIIT